MLCDDFKKISFKYFLYNAIHFVERTYLDFKFSI